jgi:hypothetical protein
MADVAKFTYNLTHCYLEVARGGMTTIHHPTLSIDEVLEQHGPNPLANAILSAVSITVLYSFLAIESFVNYQLFRVWERRHDGSPEAIRFLEQLGDFPKFEQLKSIDKARELPERLKTLCRVLAFPLPHEAIPDIWRRFTSFAEVSRHFFVHPYPDSSYLQSQMKRIMTETQSGEYVRVAEELLSYLYRSGGKSMPDWLTTNTLLRFKGIELLVDDKSPSNPTVERDAPEGGARPSP